VYFRFRAPRSIAHIPRPVRNWAELRKNFQIAVIDDEQFAPLNVLRQHGFNLTELGDITDINAVAYYPIIICDIRGVGGSFGSHLEGAHLVEEIKKRFPDKYLIANSGGAFGPEYNRALKSSEVFIRRGGPVEDWVQVLDAAIHQIGDPVQYWLRIRTLLLAHNFSTFDVFLLEDAFVKAIEKKDEFILSKAIRNANRIKNTGEILETVSGGLVSVVKLAIQIAT
jgi:hypothetical protein